MPRWKLSAISGVLSLGMVGFDLLSFGAGLIWKDNAFTAFNQLLHSSKLYNAFQFTASAIAVFSGSAYQTMKPMNRVCFVAGTLVLTASGLVAIENIKAGDKVISTNPATNESGEKAVFQTFVNMSSKLTHIFVNGEELIATPSHLFYEVTKGWIPATGLRQGSILLLPDASRAEVKCVTNEILEEPVKVYNFEVADWHTYHVGTSGVLAHNKCDVDAGKPGSPEWEKAVKVIKEGKGKGINANVETLDQARALIKEARPDLIEYTDMGDYFMRQNKISDGFELHPIEPGINKNLPHIKWRNWRPGKSGGSEGHIYIHGK